MNFTVLVAKGGLILMFLMIFSSGITFNIKSEFQRVAAILQIGSY
jgi:hypothetical protein